MATAVSTLASSSAGSRYRRLRGKSVSAPRAAFADIGDERADDSDGTFATATATRLKRRSKSVTAVDITSLRVHHNNVPLASPAGPLPTEPPPPLPAFHLHPRARAARATRAHLSSTAEERDGDAAEADEEPREEEEEGEVVVQQRPQRRKKSRADIIRQQILNKRSAKQNQGIAAGPSDSSGADSGSTTPISAAASTAAARGLTITTPGTVAAPLSASEHLQQPQDQQQHSADEHKPGSNKAEKTSTEEEQEAARLAARLEAETDRILAEQQKLDLHRLRAQLTAAHQTLSSPPTKGRSPVFEKFAFLTRGRRSNVSQATVSSMTATLSSPSSSHTASADYSFATASSDLPSSPLAAMAASKLIWAKDVPISSASIRERRVAVRYLQSTIHLSVTAATTSVDVVFSSGNYMGRNIDPAACVVVERWRSLGLERRLRRYETIRDVLDGWDDDGQNALAIVDSDRVDEDVRLLAIEAAPWSDEPPAGFTFQLHHAQRHGRWLKKWITLLENGQMFASKKPDATRTDRDIATLCHLSDFDIYALGGGDDDSATTAAAAVAATRKALKVPRRHCYAIKSMQRANLFQNGENYVHFFATDDADLAARFFDLVHQWRSWFIVNRKLPELRSRRQQQQQPHRRLDDGSVSPQIPISSTSFATVTHHHAHKTQKSISVVRSGGHALKVSVDESPYSIGAFAPLLDMDRFNKPIDEFGKDFLPAEKPAATHRAKEVPRPRNPTAANPSSPLLRQEEAAGQAQFAAGGLLGAGYDVKIKQMAAAEKMIKSSSNAAIGSSASASATAATAAYQGPFTPGKTLLSGTASAPSASAAQVGKPGSGPVPGDDDDDNDDKHEPASWFPSASEHSARQRARAQPVQPQRPERHVDPATGQMTLLQPQRRPALAPRQQQQQHYHNQQGRSLLSNFPQPPAGAVSPAAADHHSALVVPPGLIDLITTTPPMPPIPAGPPPASQRDRGHGSVSRRPSTAGNGASAGAAGATRQRSKSTAGLGARPLNHNPHPAPPPPPMPRSTSRGGREGELERARLVERERERQMMAGTGGPLQTPPLSRGGGGYQERPMMRGRSGTVKY